MTSVHCCECSALTFESCGLCVDCQCRAARCEPMYSAFARAWQKSRDAARRRAQVEAKQTPELPGLTSSDNG